jgi:hypothetical protein
MVDDECIPRLSRLFGAGSLSQSLERSLHLHRAPDTLPTRRRNADTLYAIIRATAVAV